MSAGQGIVSTWFLFGSRSGIGPYCEGEEVQNYQEIDMFETGGQYQNDLRTNIHWSNWLLNTADIGSECDNHNQRTYDGINDDSDPNFMNDYHKFGLFWDEHFIVILIDGLVYRYWLKSEPLLKRFGNAENVQFVDAMVMHLTAQYGVQELIPDSHYEGDGGARNHLQGPNPDVPIASGELRVKSFKYWGVLPDKSAPVITFIDGLPYVNDYKSISNYNHSLHGHYELATNITCANSEIIPIINEFEEEVPWAYPDQLNLIASNQITLKNGFYAKASNESLSQHNYKISSSFHAWIQDPDQIPLDQDMPFVLNMDASLSLSFKKRFIYSINGIGGMIWNSYAPSSPFKSPIITDPIIENDINKEIDIYIYPNPAEDNINVIIPITNTELNEIVILDILGNIVLIKSINARNSNIDISGLSSGVYIIKISNSKGTSTTKLIIK